MWYIFLVLSAQCMNAFWIKNERWNASVFSLRGDLSQFDNGSTELISIEANMWKDASKKRSESKADFYATKRLLFYGPCRTRECTQPSFFVEDWTAQLKWPSCWSHSIKTNLSEKRSGIVFTNSEEKCSTMVAATVDISRCAKRLPDKTRPATHSKSIPPQISGRTPFSDVDCRATLFVPDPRTVLRRFRNERQPSWNYFKRTDGDIVRSCCLRKEKHKT